MLNEIADWIDATNMLHESQQNSCSEFAENFRGFYSTEFLASASYVVTTEIPKPISIPNLQSAGLEDFLKMTVEGITYKNTYYIRPEFRDNLRLHFHELVHVAQWQLLGAEGFLKRYIEEIKEFKYDGAPLEKIAYDLELHFADRRGGIDVLREIQKKLEK